MREGSVRAADPFTLPATPSESLVAIYKAAGYEAWQDLGVVWRTAGRLAITAEPGGAVSDASAAEIRDLLRRRRRLAAIFCTVGPSGNSVPLFHAEGGAQQSGSVKRQFLQQVRKAQARCRITQISPEDWASLALACDRSAFRRQGKAEAPMLRLPERERLAQTALRAPGMEIFGCFAGDKLIAYFLGLVQAGVCHGLLMHWDEAFAGWHPTQLLYHELMTRQLDRPDIDELRIGRQAIPANEGLDRFKRYAGFASRPSHVAVLVHPRVAPVIETRLMSVALNRLRKWLPPHWPGVAALEVLELAWPSRCALQNPGDPTGKTLKRRQ